MNVRHLMWLALFGLAATSCSEELSGPQPSLPDPVAGETLPVDPGLICNAQHPEEGTPIAVTGDALAPVAFDVPGDPRVSLPDLTLTRTSSVDGGTADEAMIVFGGEPGDTNSGLLAWASQTSMTFSVTNDLAIQAGLYDLTVTNADGSSATSAAALAVVDRPVVTSASPGLVCVAQADRDLVIEGSDFLRIGDQLATVSIGETTFEPTLEGCADIAHPAIDAETCATANITVPTGGLEEGTYDVTIQNPETAACTSVADEDSITLRVVGPPVIEAAEPPAFCSESVGTETVTFTGQNFINADGEEFTVTIDGQEVTPDSVGGCETVQNAGFDAEICTSFTVTLDLAGAEIGGIEVAVTNPDVVGCGQTTSEVFEIVGPPTVTSVEPSEICSDRTETVTLRGTNFGQNATVTIGGETADMVEYVSSEEIRVTFTDGLPAGTYDVTLDNGGGCAATATGAIIVNPTPITFFVDPRVVFNGISIEVTIFTSGLQANAANVELIDDMGNVTNVTGFTSPLRPNRILATVEAGLDPGEYEVRVTSQDGCESLINGRLTVTDNLTLNLDSINPAYVSPTVDTAVTIEAADPDSFVSTPRAYLNPNPAAAGVTASPIRALVQVDGDTLTGVVPGGLSPGTYDLIIVNPTGEVGLLESALTVTADEPPVVTSVTPATFAGNADYQADIAGENFATGATVEMTCEAPDGTRTDYTATVNNVTPAQIDATLPTNGLTKGTVCVVRVINPDGSSFLFSAISITNPAFNLEPWTASTPMNTARRALALEAGRPTQTSRALYAIGGDDGTAANTYSDLEYSPVTVFGDLGAWTTQRFTLPAARSFAAKTRVGRFIYLLGGSDGTAAQDTAWRAQILDPIATPSIIDVDATLGDGTTGVGEGVWIYRVAAVYPMTDASNPGGESLPGDPQVIELPQVDDGIELTIEWEPDARASAYRVYRTPAAGDSIDSLELLAEVDAANTSFADTGLATDPAAPAPLREGETGAWHPVGSLTTAREGATAISAPLPGTTDQFVIYAMGGRDGATFHDSIDYAVVTVAADGSQSVSAWQTATATLGAGKAYLGSFEVRNFDTSAVAPGSTWIYAGPGEGAGGTFVNDLEAFEVSASGDIPSLQTVNRPVSGSRAGYGFGASNGFLYIFGGQGGLASNGGISATLCEVVQGPCANVPPDLQSGAWNSLGISMSDARLYPSTAQESAFYFIAGGSDGTGAALDSVDTTVQ